jgi:hypothetical protein
MTGIVVEYARFIEVRQRRARIVEQLIQPPPETPMAVRGPASVDDRAVELGVTRTDASKPRGAVDVR